MVEKQFSWELSDFIKPDEGGDFLYLCSYCGADCTDKNISRCVLRGCSGSVKQYDANFGIIINILERSTNCEVASYHVADETALRHNRYIEIRFRYVCSHHLHYAELPAGFEMFDIEKPGEEHTWIEKRYSEHILQLDFDFVKKISEDRAALVGWVFKHPHVRINLFEKGEE